jgi:hypothetical protein
MNPVILNRVKDLLSNPMVDPLRLIHPTTQFMYLFRSLR